jgi:hypothetical protein
MLSIHLRLGLPSGLFPSGFPNDLFPVRFEVFTAVTMKNGVFWVVTLVGWFLQEPHGVTTQKTPFFDLFPIFIYRFCPAFLSRDNNIYFVFSTFTSSSRPTSLLAFYELRKQN